MKMHKKVEYQLLRFCNRMRSKEFGEMIYKCVKQEMEKKIKETNDKIQ